MKLKIFAAIPALFWTVFLLPWVYSVLIDAHAWHWYYIPMFVVAFTSAVFTLCLIEPDQRWIHIDTKERTVRWSNSPDVG